MKKNIIPAIRLTLVCFIFFCGIYILAVWAVAQLAPGNGNGFTISDNSNTYHVNVAQSFKQDNYFWSRPSSVDYDAAGSGGSNLGPSNPGHLADVEKRINHFMEHNPEIDKADIPSDMVTTSGSGLDPHISVQAAKIQIKRIAKVRNIEEEQLNLLVEKNIEKPLFELFGTEKINVLKLNIALNKLK